MDSPTIPNLAQLKAALESTRTASRKSALTGKAAKRELQVGYANAEVEREQAKELRELEELGRELEEYAEQQQAEKIRLKQKIKSKQNKVKGLKKRADTDDLANRHMTSEQDMDVMAKKSFRTGVLQDALHLAVEEKRDFRRLTLKGSVLTPNEAHPFTKQLLADAEEDEIAFTLWTQVSKTSDNIDMWEALISNDDSFHGNGTI